MSTRERRFWWALAFVALGFAFWLGMKYPELHEFRRWTPPMPPVGK